jgi:hypothetical protein
MFYAVLFGRATVMHWSRRHPLRLLTSYGDVKVATGGCGSVRDYHEDAALLAHPDALNIRLRKLLCTDGLVDRRTLEQVRTLGLIFGKVEREFYFCSLFVGASCPRPIPPRSYDDGSSDTQS